MSGRRMRSVVFLAVAILATGVAEAGMVAKTRDQSSKTRGKTVFSVVWSWLTSSFELPGLSVLGGAPGDTTDRGFEFDPNGGPTVPVPSSVPRL